MYKRQLLTAAAEIEAAVRPKNAAAALMSVDQTPATESERIREMQREIDAIRSRFGNLSIQQGGGTRRKQRRAGKGSTNQSAAGKPLYSREGGGAPQMGILQQVPAVGPSLPR